MLPGQQSVIPDNITFTFWFVLIVGAIAVAINAYNSFNQKTNNNTTAYYSRLLESAPLAMLGGPSAFFKGFICYLIVLEAIYGLLSFSTAFLNVAFATISPIGINADRTVGALGEPSSGIVNPLTPVLASTAMAVLTQVRPFSDVDRLLRRLTHYVGGIPQNVYDVVHRLNKYTIPVSSEGVSNGFGYQAALVRAENIRQGALAHKVEPHAAEQLFSVMLRVYCLEEWTYGGEGVARWSAPNRVNLKELYDQVRREVDELDADLRSFIHPPTSPDVGAISEDTRRDWQNILHRARKASENFTDLFALLEVNEPKQGEPTGKTQLARLQKQLHKPIDRPEINATIEAVLVSAVVAFSLVVLVTVANQIEWSGAGMSIAQVDALWGSEVASQFSDAVWPNGIAETISISFLIAVSTSMALSIRRTRISNSNWQIWGQQNYPYLPFFFVSAICTVAVVPLFVGMQVLLIALDTYLSGLSFDLWDLSDFSRVDVWFYGIQGIAGFVFAWVVCILSDRTYVSSLPTQKLTFHSIAHGGAVAAATIFMIADWVHAQVKYTDPNNPMRFSESEMGGSDATWEILLIDFVEGFLLPYLVFIVFFFVFGRRVTSRSPRPDRSDANE